jgi:hypothetical protein
LISPEELQALSRTARLIGLDVFDVDVDSEPAIADGLRATTVRIVADRFVAATPGGQTAITTLFAQLAMSGLQVDIDVPNSELVVAQPPLRGGRLVDAILEYSDDLMPRGSSAFSARPDLVIAVGDNVARDAQVRVSWSEDAVSLTPGADRVAVPSGNSLPFGAIAAGAAAAAEGVRAAMPAIAARLDRPLPAESRWTRPGIRNISLSLAPFLDGLDADMGAVDAVSGGAITSALLYCLLRVPNLKGSMRVLEDDSLDLSNLNRYALARRSQVGARKIDVLSGYSGDAFEITGVPRRLESATVTALRPFRRRMVVGVDDIPSRWRAQEVAPDRPLYVGATGHDYVLATIHVPGTSCAGCSHPKSDDTDDPIPTIGFVSLWAGLIQSANLLARVPGEALASEVYPLGLENPRGVRRYEPAIHGACPIRCPASTLVVETGGATPVQYP